jgi:hypothetical protein
MFMPRNHTTEQNDNKTAAESLENVTTFRHFGKTVTNQNCIHEDITSILSSGNSILGGLVVVCLLLDPRFAGSNPTEGDRFLKATKICSTVSFGGEVKLSAPCRKILWHVKEPFEVL